MDGFEAGLSVNRWNAAKTISTTYGRLGGSGVRIGEQFNDLIAKTVTISDATIAYAFAINLQSVADGERFLQNAFGSGTFLVWNSTNDIEIQNVPDAGTDYASTSGTFTTNVWHWVEAEVKWSDTVGTIKVWVDGVLEIDESGLNTITQPASVTATFGGTGASDLRSGYLDDVVIMDGAGSYNTTRPMGDAEVTALYPDGDGATIGLTGSDGNQVDNHLLVDEPNEPVTSDFCGSPTQGDLDTYTLDNLADSGATIFAVQLENYVAKSDTGTKFGRGIIRTASTNYAQASIGLSISYELDSTLLEENPNTTNAWTGTEVDALEAGFEVRDS